ncbi:hypothetical protein N8307_03265, partial [Planktomarina temperata]|nr:hypothetical protein [Planktomarina temperata]
NPKCRNRCHGAQDCIGRVAADDQKCKSRYQGDPQIDRPKAMGFAPEFLCRQSTCGLPRAL